MSNHKVSQQFEYDFVLSFLVSLDCSRSLQIAILYRYNQFEDIVNLDFDPYLYNSFEDARDTLLATEFLRKHKDLETNIDLEAVCLDGFFAAEDRCRITNDLFFSADFLPNYAVLSRARRKIEQILGYFCENEFVDACCWGPGATLSIKRKDATYANKFRNKSEFTLASYNFVKTWIAGQFPNWSQNPRIYEGNRITTVPKSAKTNRVIGIEPSVNLFLQKGVGTMIRRRLKRSTVDLNDQTKNQKLAKLASLTNRLATVDFSAASDTISYWLVEFLLPERWFKVMDKLRCPRGAVGDKLVEYEKFSSMGNGFTFELESLIFYAIAKSIVPDGHDLSEAVSIYGDDLIIPSEFEDVCIDVFKTCGFVINRSKTYFSSYYRESCGSHYWDGKRIAPVYLRRSLQNIEDLIKAHNQMVRSHAITFGIELEGYGLTNPIKLIRNLASRKGVPYVPTFFGDLGLNVPFEVAAPKSRFDKKTHCLGFEFFWRSVKPVEYVEDDWSFLLEKLLGLHLGRDAEGYPYDSASNGNVRKLSSNRVRLVKAFTWTWPSPFDHYGVEG